jgi:hypothetical protein
MIIYIYLKTVMGLSGLECEMTHNVKYVHNPIECGNWSMSECGWEVDGNGVLNLSNIIKFFLIDNG